MPFLRAFGCHLPSRVVENSKIAALAGVEPAWILQSTGIEQRRFAAPEDTVASLGIRAARDCLEAAQMAASEIGLILCASGSAERRFPGPATAIGAGLGVCGMPTY